MSSRPYRVLRHRDFRRLWGSQFVSQIGTQMQTAALHWHVYLLAGSPVALGAVGLTRVLPLVLFSLWGGVLADRADRRKLMFASQAAMLAGSLVLAALTLTGHTPLAALFALNAVLAAAAAFDNPARQSLLPRLVPASELAPAVSLNLGMFHAATISGPALAGLLLASGSGGGADLATATPRLAAIYGLNALSFLGVLAALVTMKTSGAPATTSGAHEPAWQALRVGLRFVVGTPIMVWSAGLDFFATFFAGALSLLPIVADQVLHVGARGYGALLAAPAVGALIGSLYTAARGLPQRQGRLLLGSVAGYGAATIVLGLSRSYWLIFAALAATGLFDSLSTVVRQTLRQLLTPDALRGRMTAVNMIFFVGGPQLGEFEAGLLAGAFTSAALGASVSIASGGLATLLVVGIVAWLAPVIRNYSPESH